MTDLLVVVADQDCEEAMHALLDRPEALHIRAVNYRLVRNVLRDSGCRTDIVSLLRPYLGRCERALVVFDREGSGAEQQSREEIEAAVEHDLRVNGWGDHAAAVVIDPELEAWVWSDSEHVDAALGWGGRGPEVRSWLKSHTEYWPANTDKPERPKEAMRQALREARKPVSASLFRRLAERVSVNRCADPAFDKLKRVLHDWFGA